MRKYLLTLDIPQVLAPWARRNGFNLPDKHIFAGYHDRICKASARVLDGVAVVQPYPLEQLVDGIHTLLRRYASNLPIVVMDRAVSEAGQFKNAHHYVVQ